MSRERRARRVILVDSDGRPTDDPASAVAGEVVELTEDRRPLRRTRFFLTREQLPAWMPFGEPAFLLWVLAALVAAWAIVGVVLAAT